MTAADPPEDQPTVTHPHPIAEAPPASATRISARISTWIGFGVSAALLVVILWQAYSFRLGDIVRLVPQSPLFWLLFVLNYFAGPIADLAIFRRVWGMPLSGFFPLLRKQVSNELLLGYLGELYFYSWSRRHVKVSEGTFGAVKDAAILSAVVGNVLTLVLLVVSIPLLAPVIRQMTEAISPAGVIGSIAIILLTSLAALLFRRHLFSLPPRDLWFVIVTYVLRTFVSMGFLAWMWHLVLPSVSIALWLLLATIRLLLSRLPLMPNKDVVFAGLALLLVGAQQDVGALMTMMAGLVLIAHLTAGGALVVEAVIRRVTGT